MEAKAEAAVTVETGIERAIAGEPGQARVRLSAASAALQES